MHIVFVVDDDNYSGLFRVVIVCNVGGLMHVVFVVDDDNYSGLF